MATVAPPPRNDISGTSPNPSNAVARAGFGTLWDYVTNLLGVTGSPAAARTALGAAATGSGFRADNNGANITGIANVTFTKLTLGTERHDINNEFTGGTFTAKSAGLHRFYFQMGTVNPTASQSIRTLIYLNGSSIAEGVRVLNGTILETVSVYTELVLSVGNTVEFYVWHNRGTSEDILGATRYTFYTGAFVG
jgi:hypothetical protein